MTREDEKTRKELQAAQERIEELEKSNSDLVASRGIWEEVATQLAFQISEHLGFDIGEHSSQNCPVENASGALAESETISEIKQREAKLKSKAFKYLDQCFQYIVSRRRKLNRGDGDMCAAVSFMKQEFANATEQH